MYFGLTEVSVLRMSASKETEKISAAVNKKLDEGWVLMDISTEAPNTLAGQYGSDNYFLYHFGKFKQGQ